YLFAHKDQETTSSSPFTTPIS
ncbi:hypothetical protein A2U01_0032518, partial [Trifolium medium]|nr:hypothetical protein [Trifolium medium]